MQTAPYTASAFTFETNKPLKLEVGDVLQGLQVQYHTIGELNASKSNVVWIFHALTANSNPLEWWPEMIAKDNPIDPERDFIICANVIGSCYGSTEPENFEFPLLTIGDLVHANQLLKEWLGIQQIRLGIGGSLGGQQLLEWAVREPELFQVIVPIATNARHSAWGIAFNEAQRMALKNSNLKEGLEAARAIAMLSYRNYEAYNLTQTDNDGRMSDFSAATYQVYQGKKLSKRFSPYSYYSLSIAMDSHNVGRKYKSVEQALARIHSKVVSIGISSDVLFPLVEQELIADSASNGIFYSIDSLYGHDGFLLEIDQMNAILRKELT